MNQVFNSMPELKIVEPWDLLWALFVKELAMLHRLKNSFKTRISPCQKSFFFFSRQEPWLMKKRRQHWYFQDQPATETVPNLQCSAKVSIIVDIRVPLWRRHPDYIRKRNIITICFLNVQPLFLRTQLLHFVDIYKIWCIYTQYIQDINKIWCPIIVQ